VWCAGLRTIAILNLLVWGTTCLPLAGQSSIVSWQVALSGVYVAVCAFRSWLPRIDLERYCIYDTPLSSPFVGRSLATLAEVCFAVQVALCLHQLGVLARIPWIATAALFVVPPLALAQVFCWHSVLTLNHLGHAIENSLWTLTMAGVGVCLVAATGNLHGGPLLFVSTTAALALGFVIFMALNDVPMYVRRWRESRRERRRYLSLREGLRDARHRLVITRDWADWRSEVAWLTGYFSIAVWLSLSLVYFSGV